MSNSWRYMLSFLAGAVLVLLLILVLDYTDVVNFSGGTKPVQNSQPTQQQNEEPQPQTRTISLYYYNQNQDPNNACSRDAVRPVSREIAVTQTPVQDAVKLLLKGQLTTSEEAAGFTTEFPLSGLTLKGANLKDGNLTLEFSDPQNKTVGGSCRVGLLWAQIEKTALQFEGVEEVEFIPEELFQP